MVLQVTMGNCGSVDQSPGDVTKEIHGGTVAHQLSGQHGEMVWQITKWNGGSMNWSFCFVT